MHFSTATCSHFHEFQGPVGKPQHISKFMIFMQNIHGFVEIFLPKINIQKIYILLKLEISKISLSKNKIFPKIQPPSPPPGLRPGFGEAKLLASSGGGIPGIFRTHFHGNSTEIPTEIGPIFHTNTYRHGRPPRGAPFHGPMEARMAGIGRETGPARGAQACSDWRDGVPEGGAGLRPAEINQVSRPEACD